MLFAATFLATTWAVPLARATDAPADACSLLTAGDVSKTIGQAYGAPQKSVAPRPYANTVEGTDCRYESNGNGKELWFRVYFDPSPSATTELFAKLKAFYSPPTPVSGIGDEAYIDPRHGLHVRKGNVRFFLDLGESEKQIKDLASLVAGRL
jgi:hypothetical protein